MIFETLFDGKVLALLGISLFLFLLGALKQNHDSRVRVDVITNSQTAGFFLWQSIDRWVDYIFYPVIVTIFGIVRGGLIMIAVTLVQNVAYIIVNNATEEDWTFMSWFTYLRDTKSHVWPIRYYRLLRNMQIQTFRPFSIRLLWIVRKVFNLKIKRFNPSNTIGFLYLSIWRDSFYAVNFLYHKNTDLRKWKVLGLFLVSHIICNAVWAPIARVIGGIAQYVFQLFSSL